MSQSATALSSRPRSKVVGLAVVVLALLLGACADSDDAGEATTVTNETTIADPSAGSADPGEGSTLDGEATPTTRRTVAPEIERAEVKAQGANLVIADFESGWEHLPPAEASRSALEVCSSVDLDTHLLAKYVSDSFSYTIEPGSLNVSSASWVLDGADVATGVIADFNDPGFAECAGGLFSEGTDMYSVAGTFARNEVPPALGDEAVAMSGDYTITPNDGSPVHQMSVIVVAVRSGDTIATLSGSAVDRPADPALWRDLSTKLEAHLLAQG